MAGWEMVFKKNLKNQWTRRELNPRPLRCERNDLPLIYEPKNEMISENNLDI